MREALAQSLLPLYRSKQDLWRRMDAAAPLEHFQWLTLLCLPISGQGAARNSQKRDTCKDFPENPCHEMP